MGDVMWGGPDTDTRVLWVGGKCFIFTNAGPMLVENIKWYDEAERFARSYGFVVMDIQDKEESDVDNY